MPDFQNQLYPDQRDFVGPGSHDSGGSSGPTYVQVGDALDFYVDFATGDSANSGLSADLPLPTIQSVLAKLRVGYIINGELTIHLAAGVYGTTDDTVVVYGLQGFGLLIIAGVTDDPTQVTFNPQLYLSDCTVVVRLQEVTCTNAVAILVSERSEFSVGVLLVYTGSGVCFQVSDGGIIRNNSGITIDSPSVDMVIDMYNAGLAFGINVRFSQDCVFTTALMRIASGSKQTGYGNFVLNGFTVTGPAYLISQQSYADCPMPPGDTGTIDASSFAAFL